MNSTRERSAAMPSPKSRKDKLRSQNVEGAEEDAFGSATPSLSSRSSGDEAEEEKGKDCKDAERELQSEEKDSPSEMHPEPAIKDTDCHSKDAPAQDAELKDSADEDGHGDHGDHGADHGAGHGDHGHGDHGHGAGHGDHGHGHGHKDGHECCDHGGHTSGHEDGHGHGHKDDHGDGHECCDHGGHTSGHGDGHGHGHKDDGHGDGHGHGHKEKCNGMGGGASPSLRWADESEMSPTPENLESPQNENFPDEMKTPLSEEVEAPAAQIPEAEPNTDKDLDREDHAPPSNTNSSFREKKVDSRPKIKWRPKYPVEGDEAENDKIADEETSKAKRRARSLGEKVSRGKTQSRTESSRVEKGDKTVLRQSRDFLFEDVKHPRERLRRVCSADGRASRQKKRSPGRRDSDSEASNSDSSDPGRKGKRKGRKGSKKERDEAKGGGKGHGKSSPDQGSFPEAKPYSGAVKSSALPAALQGMEISSSATSLPTTELATTAGPTGFKRNGKGHDGKGHDGKSVGDSKAAAEEAKTERVAHKEAMTIRERLQAAKKSEGDEKATAARLLDGEWHDVHGPIGIVKDAVLRLDLGNEGLDTTKIHLDIEKRIVTMKFLGEHVEGRLDENADTICFTNGEQWRKNPKKVAKNSKGAPSSRNPATGSPQKTAQVDAKNENAARRPVANEDRASYGLLKMLMSGPNHELVIKARGMIPTVEDAERFSYELENKLKSMGSPEDVAIEDFDVSENPLPFHQIEAIVHTLSTCVKQVKRVRLFKCPTVNDDVCTLLADWLANVNAKSAPLELHLSDCVIGNKGFMALMHAIEHNDAFPHVRRNGDMVPLYLRIDQNYIHQKMIWNKVQIGAIVPFQKNEKPGAESWLQKNSRTGKLRRPAKVRLLVGRNGLCEQMSDFEAPIDTRSGAGAGYYDGGLFHRAGTGRRHHADDGWDAGYTASSVGKGKGEPAGKGKGKQHPAKANDAMLKRFDPPEKAKATPNSELVNWLGGEDLDSKRRNGRKGWTDEDMDTMNRSGWMETAQEGKGRPGFPRHQQNGISNQASSSKGAARARSLGQPKPSFKGASKGSYGHVNGPGDWEEHAGKGTSKGSYGHVYDSDEREERKGKGVTSKGSYGHVNGPGDWEDYNFKGTSKGSYGRYDDDYDWEERKGKGISKGSPRGDHDYDWERRGKGASKGSYRYGDDTDDWEERERAKRRMRPQLGLQPPRSQPGPQPPLRDPRLPEEWGYRGPPEIRSRGWDYPDVPHEVGSKGSSKDRRGIIF